MPHYDFKCLSCEREIQVFASMQQLAQKEVACPHCSGKDLHRLFKSAPYVGRLAPAMDLGAMNRKNDPESCCVWDPSTQERIV